MSNTKLQKQLLAAMFIVSLPAHAATAATTPEGTGTLQRVDLRKGNALVDPVSPTQVETPGGDLIVLPGAQAFVMTAGDNVAVFHLNEVNRGDVVMIHNKQRITLSPGQELVIAKQTSGDFAASNPGAMIPYRSLTKHQLDDGATAYSAEFSVLSLVKAVKPLKAKLTSNSPQDQAKIKSILKNGLILSQGNSHKGDFQFAGQPAKGKDKRKSK